MLRKELKIKGQIGVAHRKDKSTYFSLIHQINEAQKHIMISLQFSAVLLEKWALVCFWGMCWKLYQFFLTAVFFNIWSPILRKRVRQICVENWLQWFSYRKSQNIIMERGVFELGKRCYPYWENQISNMIRALWWYCSTVNLRGVC